MRLPALVKQVQLLKNAHFIFEAAKPIYETCPAEDGCVPNGTGILVKNMIADRKLHFTTKGSSEKQELVVRVGVPYLDKDRIARCPKE